jgi:hypothetical protein
MSNINWTRGKEIDHYRAPGYGRITAMNMRGKHILHVGDDQFV